MLKQKKGLVLMLIFLASELVLYYFIFTASGSTLVWSSFGAIVLCFLYTLTSVDKENALLVPGLFFTVLADLCLVVWEPIQRLWGMIFFLITQSLYAAYLHRRGSGRAILSLRLILSVAVEIAAILILRRKTDALALVSVCYYANLIMNIVAAFFVFRRQPMFPIALVLFILCDTVIGLQVAATGYLPIAKNSLLHRILFMDFNLSWLFYLPSQVLIALFTHDQAKRHGP